MALSKAQKLRKKAEREGGMNPSEQRLGWNGVNPVTKVTPTKLERLHRLENKHRWKRNSCHEDDGSVFYYGNERRYLGNFGYIPMSNRTQRLYSPFSVVIVLEWQAGNNVAEFRKI